MLIQSNLVWTIVRPVGLTNKDKAKPIIESYNNNPKPGLTISRRSVAEYMVEALDRRDLIDKAVTLSS